MKISIITATYNSSFTILDCINSVNRQTYENIEHIIVDGLSTDNTLELIGSVPNRVKTIISEKDFGIYDAMNKGIKCATGEIIAILNSDDLYSNNNIIDKVVDKFRTNSNLGIFYGDLQYVKKDNLNKIVRNWLSLSYYDKFFEDGNVPPHPSVFVLKNVYNEVGYFNIKYKLAADYEFMLRAFKTTRYDIEYNPILIVKMRLGGATNKSIKNIINGNLEISKSWIENNYKRPLLLFPKRLFKRVAQFL